MPRGRCTLLSWPEFLIWRTHGDRLSEGRSDWERAPSPLVQKSEEIEGPLKHPNASRTSLQLTPPPPMPS
ncbi:unnamed protein product [Caenorhabditis brenneri]